MPDNDAPLHRPLSSDAVATDLLVLALACALKGIRYPARPWQLLAQADHYGASWSIRAALARLPIAGYNSLAEVLAELDVTPLPPTSSRAVSR